MEKGGERESEKGMGKEKDGIAKSKEHEKEKKEKANGKEKVKEKGDRNRDGEDVTIGANRISERSPHLEETHSDPSVTPHHHHFSFPFGKTPDHASSSHVPGNSASRHTPSHGSKEEMKPKEESLEDELTSMEKTKSDADVIHSHGQKSQKSKEKVEDERRDNIFDLRSDSPSIVIQLLSFHSVKSKKYRLRCYVTGSEKSGVRWSNRVLNGDWKGPASRYLPIEGLVTDRGLHYPGSHDDVPLVFELLQKEKEVRFVVFLLCNLT